MGRQRSEQLVEQQWKHYNKHHGGERYGPIALADTLTATEDTPVTIFTAAQLLGNDTDVDNPNSALIVRSITSGTGGNAQLNANGTITFTPNANFNGPADFTYTVTDGSTESAPATVTVNVAAVNDAPVVAIALADRGTPEDAASIRDPCHLVQ